MSVNKFEPHVYVIPEDRANEQIANGFIGHDQVRDSKIQVLPTAGGWSSVLETFKTEYVPYLRNNNNGYVILLIDFDSKYENRRKRCDDDVPADVKDRVFVVGAIETHERLRRALSSNYEAIGELLAEDCFKGTSDVWGHDHLNHNQPDLQRLLQSVRPILFPTHKKPGPVNVA
jgi:hypothetical protein